MITFDKVLATFLNHSHTVELDTRYVNTTGDAMTGPLSINANSTAALLVERDGVEDNLLVVDTTNGAVNIGTNVSAGTTALNIVRRFPSIRQEVVRNQVGDSGAAFQCFDLYATNDTATVSLVRLGAYATVTQGASPYLNYFFIGAAWNDTTIRIYPSKNVAFGGNVGIGTTGPEAKLHVAGGNILLGNNQYYQGERADGVNLNILGVDGSNNIQFGSGSAQDIYFDTYNFDNAMVIKGTSGNVGIGTTSPATKLELQETKTITGLTADAYAAALTLDPAYTAVSAQTVTRANYLDIQDPALTNVTITNACVMGFDAAAGTHKAVDSGSTKTTPGTVDAWVKININGTVYYMPAYTSTTS